jgi:hypothetical protein
MLVICFYAMKITFVCLRIRNEFLKTAILLRPFRAASLLSILSSQPLQAGLIMTALQASHLIYFQVLPFKISLKPQTSNLEP